MSAIINFSINLESIPKELIIKAKKGYYINLTAFVNDETKFGNNASIVLAQDKEDREAEKPKTYIGNGKVVWVSEDGVTTAEREQDVATPQVAEESGDLPF